MPTLCRTEAQRSWWRTVLAVLLVSLLVLVSGFWFWGCSRTTSSSSEGMDNECPPNTNAVSGRKAARLQKTMAPERNPRRSAADDALLEGLAPEVMEAKIRIPPHPWHGQHL